MTKEQKFGKIAAVHIGTVIMGGVGVVQDAEWVIEEIGRSSQKAVGRMERITKKLFEGITLSPGKTHEISSKDYKLKSRRPSWPTLS